MKNKQQKQKDYIYFTWMIGKTEEELKKKKVQVIRTCSFDIHMEFRFDKCAEIVLKRGKSFHSQNLILYFNREIQEPEQGKTYKYLGPEEREGVHQKMKD